MHLPAATSLRKTPSLLAAALRNAVLASVALCVVPSFATTEDADAEVKAPAASAADTRKAPKKAAATAARTDSKVATARKGSGDRKKATAATRKGQDLTPGPLADFGKEEAAEEVVHVANWVSHTRNAKKKAFVVIDKKNARMYVFDPVGKLKSSTPVLLGKAVGDHVAPGVGNKPISQLKEDEKTTPAGRFLAQPGKNNHGEDIIWIDYNSAVSMHRLRKVSAEERRAERMATPDISDNRISNGCVNVPHAFYNGILKPTVTRHGAYVYVLPETKTPQQLFGSFDVKDKAVQVAQAPAAGSPAK
jgi:lipoprotein-anchoring transpeptidase ErfK/SrfK